MVKPDQPRVAWFAATRSDVLRLVPLYRALAPAPRSRTRPHWFVFTAEQGMAAYQALDYFDFHPDEDCELRRPAEDPTLRLQGLIARIETVIRNRRISHALFTGFGPTATAAAIVCHGRQCRGLWLRPPDPAGLVRRLRWEGGLVSIIGSLAAAVSVLPMPFPASVGGPDSAPPDSHAPTRSASGPAAIGGRRTDAPLVMICIGRSLWGMHGILERVVAASARWAREMPSVDWLLFRSLDARMEGPLQSMADRPSNLLATTPIPYPQYSDLLARSAAVVTDSPHIAAECMEEERPVAALGELPSPQGESCPGRLIEITPEDLEGEDLRAFLDRAIQGSLERPPAKRSLARPEDRVLQDIQDWLRGEDWSE